jgi:hypothetical protein
MNRVLRLAAATGFWVLCVSSLACGAPSHSEEVANPPTEKVKLLNGRLVFSDKEGLAAVVQELKGLSSEELERWEESLGHTSLRRMRASMGEQEKPFMPTLFAALLNSEGEYQVGSNIVLVRGDEEFIIPNQDEALLSQLKASPDRAQAVGVIQHSIVKTLTPLPSGNEVSALAINSRYSCEFTPTDHTYRFVASAYNWADYYMAYLGIYVEFQYWFSRWYKKEWRPAGETTRKIFSNVEWKYSPPFSYYWVHEQVSYYETEQSGDLDVLLAYAPSYGGYTHLVEFIQTNFSGEIMWDSRPGCGLSSMRW